MRLDASHLDTFLLVSSVVTLVAIVGVRWSSRTGLPSLLLYLLIGVLLGESVIGVDFENARLTHAAGFAALALILAEGGLTTSWPEVRPAFRIGVLLATIGVAVSVGVMTLFAHFVLGLSWQLAVLLGAVTSPTDAAAVFSVLRVVPLPRRVSGALEMESGLNDAPTVVVVTLVSSGAWATYGVPVALLIMAGELAGGVVLGWAVGRVGVWLMRRVALPASGLYPLLALCLAMVAYTGASALHLSGFAAVYVAALVLGNHALPHGATIRSFAEGIAWLAQIGLFVMLGLLLSPSRISASTIGLALAAGLVLTLVARPLSVLAANLAGDLTWREAGFVSWAGLRGAVPIVLATIPLTERLPDAHRLFDLVFVLVVVFTLLTGPTLPWAARRFGVARPSLPRGLDIEVAPLDRVAADLLEVGISDESRLHGVEVGELRLPEGAVVSMVIRAGATLVPDPGTVLRRGDSFLVVTPRNVRAQTTRRLQQVSLGGRLATWRGIDLDRA